MFKHVLDNQKERMWWNLNGLLLIFTCPLRLTVRNERSDEAGGSSYDVRGGERKPSADAFDGEEDEEGGGELHQARDEEVDVDVSFQNTQPHDQTLVDHSAGEPGGRRRDDGRWAPKNDIDDNVSLQT